MAIKTILLPGLVLACAVAALVWVVLRALPERLHPRGGAPIGTMVSGLVLVFAFVIGLTISQETSALSAASSATSAEANSIGELYWYAHALPEPEHSRLQAELRDYTTTVVNTEWPLLGNHKSSPKASADIRAIRFDVLGYQPVETTAQRAVYGNMISEVSSLFKARRNRLDVSTNGGVPPILIEGIVLITIITILVLPFTGKINKLGELAIFTLFATFLFATLFFVADLNNPFKGNVALKPTSFNILFTGTFKNVS